MNENIFTIQAEPDEEYTFNYTEEELTDVFRIQRKTTYKKPVRGLILLFIIAILSIVISTHPFGIGFTVGVLAFGIINTIKSIRWFNKTWNANSPKIARTTYEYKVYDDYFIFNIYRNNERIRQSKCYFENIEKVQKLDKWLLLQFGGQAVILRENDLKENSVFLTYVQKNSVNK